MNGPCRVLGLPLGVQLGVTTDGLQTGESSFELPRGILAAVLVGESGVKSGEQLEEAVTIYLQEE
jgi:hypothetical protein